MALANPLPENEVTVGLTEDLEPMKQLMVELFTDRERREIDVDSDDVSSADESTEDAENTKKVVDDVAEITRFNNYMDAVYRRMNAAVRAKMMDPMVLNLSGDKAGKKSAAKKSEKKDKKKRKARNLEGDDTADEMEVSANVEEDDDAVMEDADAAEVYETEDESVGRKMTKPDKKKKSPKANKGAAKNKQAKGKLTAAERKVNRAEKKRLRKAGLAERKKNKKANAKMGDKKEKKNKKEKKEKKEKKNSETRESRSKRNKNTKNTKNEKEGKHKKNENQGKHHKNEKEAKNNKNAKQGKHNKNAKEGKKDAKAKKNDFSGKSMGSLAGIATLRRSGDVTLLDEGSFKVVKSEFSIGPLQLEVSKTFGSGKSRSVKTAKAVTEQLIGKITLKVKPDGSAHVKSVSFKKPENVEVRGSLGDQKKRSDNYLKQSVGKVRPMAAQRLLKMARYVLKSPSTVERS